MIIIMTFSFIIIIMNCAIIIITMTPLSDTRLIA